MRVNSRGRAALREAPRKSDQILTDPERVKQVRPGSTLSGSDFDFHVIRGLRAKPLAHGYSISSFQDDDSLVVLLSNDLALFRPTTTKLPIL